MRSKIYFSVICFLFGFQMTAFAEVYLKGDSIHLLQDKDSLYIDCLLEYNKPLKSGETVEIVPALIAGYNLRVLNKVVLNGDKRQKVYQRKLDLMSEKARNEFKNTVYSDHGFRKNEIVRVPYQIVIPYEEWMSEAVFRVYESNCFCGESILKKQKHRRRGNAIGEHPEYTLARDYKTLVSLEKERFFKSLALQVVFIAPEISSCNNQKQDFQIQFEYKVSETQLDESVLSNFRSLDELTTQIKSLIANGAQIDSVLIKGYASPEGLYSTNEDIAKERARLLKKKIVAVTALDERIIGTEAIEEDWEGLRDILIAKSPDFKDKVLNVIDTYGIFKGRESRLMDLDRGRPYLYMLENYFPQLRRVKFQINFSHQEKSAEEIKSLFDQSPEKLSLNDLNYLLLENKPGTEQYARILKLIRTAFPEDETAQINEVALALKNGQMESARDLLDKMKSKGRYPEYENNKAVLYIYDGAFKEAEKLLKDAAGAGLDEAASNLKNYQQSIK